jgi:hypothetical protein
MKNIDRLKNDSTNDDDENEDDDRESNDTTHSSDLENSKLNKVGLPQQQQQQSQSFDAVRAASYYNPFNPHHHAQMIYENFLNKNISQQNYGVH